MFDNAWVVARLWWIQNMWNVVNLWSVLSKMNDFVVLHQLVEIYYRIYLFKCLTGRYKYIYKVHRDLICNLSETRQNLPHGTYKLGPFCRY